MLFKRGRRRSDRFAEMLDESTGRRRRHRRSELDVELAPLVATAAEASATRAAPEPTDEFKTGLRAMLMATAEREGIGVTADEKAAQAASRAAMSAKTTVVKQVRTPSSGRARAAVIIGVMAGALLLSGVSAASTNALPGNPLYQVKRTNERAQLALAGSDASRGRLYLDFAAGRLHRGPPGLGRLDRARPQGHGRRDGGRGQPADRRCCPPATPARSPRSAPSCPRNGGSWPASPSTHRRASSPSGTRSPCSSGCPPGRTRPRPPC